MEEKKLEQAPISQEEFEKKIHEVAEANRRKVEEDFYGKEPGKEILHLRDYSGVRKFKSISSSISINKISNIDSISCNASRSIPIEGNVFGFGVIGYVIEHSISNERSSINFINYNVVLTK